MMHRFELATCFRLAEGASGVVRADILVASGTPQHVAYRWEVKAADVQWTDALYPLAQQAMQRGYFMPNRNSTAAAGICVRTGAAVSRILAASWHHETI
jgi:hypothetical protein